MALSGPDVGEPSSICRSQPRSGLDAALVEVVAFRAGGAQAADPRTVVAPGSDSVAASVTSSMSEFDAAEFVEFAERHLEWLDRVDGAESAAWREVRSRGGRIYTCMHSVPDDEGVEPLCVDVHSGEMLTSPGCEHIEAGACSAVVGSGPDRCTAAIEAELPACDVPDPGGFSSMLNAYLQYALRTELSFVLERLPFVMRPYR